jgi:hypothetical protein
MSTDDHGQTHQNGIGQDADVTAGSHARPHEASASTANNTDPTEHVPPHPEDHASDNEVANNASISPVVQLIPQTVSLHAESKTELYHEDAANTTASGRHSDDDGTDDEEDDEEEDEEEEEGEEEDEEEEDDDDDDDEPALKYERFGGGGYQDLLKKDSASALAVSDKFLVRYIVFAQQLLLTLLHRRSVHTMGSHISWT